MFFVFPSQKPDSIVPELSKLNQGNVSAAKEQTNLFKDPWAHCQTSPCPSPPFIERMRCKPVESLSTTSVSDDRHFIPLTLANVYQIFHDGLNYAIIIIAIKLV